MEDNEIVRLFHERSETAITETKTKYHRLLLHIAENITGSRQDAEECVNDAYMKIWLSVPPEKPRSLKAYTACIVRNLAVNRYNSNKAKMRNGDRDLIFDELSECIPSQSAVCTDQQLSTIINGFISTLDGFTRVLFIRRYWQAESIPSLAKQLGMKEGAVKMRLSRTRARFKDYLEKECVLNG